MKSRTARRRVVVAVAAASALVPLAAGTAFAADGTGLEHRSDQPQPPVHIAPYPVISNSWQPT